MATQELKPVYLVTGSDRPKIDLTLERLRTRFDPGAIERLAVAGKDGATGADVVAACNAGSLLGDARLVLVSDVGGTPDDRGRLTGGWKAADHVAVEAYLTVPAPGTVLCLVGEGVKSDSKLWKACAKAGQVLAWEVNTKKLEGWVADAFSKRAVKADHDACRRLLEIVGEDDLLSLELEIDKLATWADGEPLGVEEVTKLATRFPRDDPPWTFTDALGNRDSSAALTVMEDELRARGRAGREEAPRLAAQLGGHLSKLTGMRRLLDDGVQPKDAAAKLGMKPFPAAKLARQAERFSIEELRDATLRLARLDHALKGGSRLAAELELQLAIADLARGPV